MMIYDVITVVKNPDNVDKLDKIFERRCFNTSMMTGSVYDEIKTSAIEIYKMGEVQVYERIKEHYQIKI
ncbi:hypothetical protein BpsM61_00046 [Bacillus phage vB_BpsM-61]|nr:hypothetical protein BpsM61_00046 [Bacillus phage vB_BpsM-61]